MTTIMASRPHGVNHSPAPQASNLTFEQTLRLERRTLTGQLAQSPNRPCLLNAAPWDENVAKPAAMKLCKGCPLAASRACARVTVIDEAIIFANSGRVKSHLYMIVRGTRGGMNPHTRRPLVKELADLIVTARADELAARAAREAKVRAAREARRAQKQAA